MDVAALKRGVSIKLTPLFFLHAFVYIRKIYALQKRTLEAFLWVAAQPLPTKTFHSCHKIARLHFQMVGIYTRARKFYGRR